MTSTLKFITIELKKTTKNVLNQIKFYARNNEHEQHNITTVNSVTNT
jgi:hypothetical protein